MENNRKVVFAHVSEYHTSFGTKNWIQFGHFWEGMGGISACCSLGKGQKKYPHSNMIESIFMATHVLGHNTHVLHI